jgi:hypothetical protein
MTMATDTDIREIKDLINGLREEMRSGFADANTRTSDLREEMRLGFADANTRTGALREEVRLGFSDLKGQINTVEAKLEGQIGKLDERIQLGFWGFILRGTFLAVSTTMLATLTTIFVSYVLPILLQNLPKP